MARRQIVVRVCDRCPGGREKPASRTETLALGANTWELDLCEGCWRRLDAVVAAWSGLGRLRVPAFARVFPADYATRARHAAQLRPTPSAAMPSTPSPLPTAWVFTGHARDRLAQRGISAASAHLNPRRPPGGGCCFVRRLRR